MNRVLLTGASGFVGRHAIAPLLARGCEVHVTSRKGEAVHSAHAHQVNLLDETAASELLDAIRPTHLIHLAWNTEPPDYWSSPQNTLWQRASTRLVESFINVGGQRLVIAGTCAEYEWGSDILKEGTTPERPSTAYGQAKLALLRRSKALTQEAGLSFAWARFFFLFGPFERSERFVPSLIDSLSRGESALCRNGDLQRDFLYVEDAANATIALTYSNAEGVVNIASGESISLGNLAESIGLAFGRSDLIKVEHGSTTSSQPASLVADVTRLRSDVGWRPRYTLREAISRTLSWRNAWAEYDDSA